MEELQYRGTKQCNVANVTYIGGQCGETLKMFEQAKMRQKLYRGGESEVSFDK